LLQAAEKGKQAAEAELLQRKLQEAWGNEDLQCIALQGAFNTKNAD